MADCPELKKLHWRCVVIDEAHRLKNRNCKLLEGLKLMNLVSLSICLMIRMYSTCGNDVMFVKYNLHQWLLSYVIVDWSVLRWKSKNKCNQQLFRSLCQLVHPPFGGDSFRPRRQTFDMEVRSLCVCVWSCSRQLTKRCMAMAWREHCENFEIVKTILSHTLLMTHHPVVVDTGRLCACECMNKPRLHVPGCSCCEFYLV